MKFNLEKAMSGEPVAVVKNDKENKNTAGRFVTELTTTHIYKYAFAIKLIPDGDEAIVQVNSEGHIMHSENMLCMKPPVEYMWLVAHKTNLYGWVGYWTTNEEQFKRQLTEHPNAVWTKLELPSE